MSTSTAKFTINGLTYVVTLENPPPENPPPENPPPKNIPPKVTTSLNDPDSEEMKQQILQSNYSQNIYRITDGTKARTHVVKTRVDADEKLTLIDDDTILILVNMKTGDIYKCRVKEINSIIPLNTPNYTTDAFSDHVNNNYYAFYPTMPSIHTGRNPYQGGGSRRKYGKSKRAKSYKLAHR